MLNGSSLDDALARLPSAFSAVVCILLTMIFVGEGKGTVRYGAFALIVLAVAGVVARRAQATEAGARRFQRVSLAANGRGVRLPREVICA